MRAHIYSQLVAILIIAPAFVAYAGDAANEAPASQFFHAEIEPILVGRCLTCHGGDRKAELDLRSGATLETGGKSGAAVTPGDAGASLLYQKVAAGEMPPDDALSETEVAAIRRWIDDGAYFPDTPLDPFAATTDKRAGYDWWSFQPIEDVEPPAVSDERWNGNAIDRFIYARLQESKLEPSPPAHPRNLIRRATYDLTGLPPTPQDVNDFIAECEAETGSRAEVGERAYEALIDRLLASPRYGEQWGRHWLDVVRFGESTGYEVNHVIDNLWPFRDYVIESFNNDKPFDRLIREHIAGDSVDPGNPDVEIGMAFLVAGPYDIVGNKDPVQAAQIRANTVDEMIRATTESFIGLTVGCARCHDHKFDPISQRDYYELYATFGGVSHGNRTVATEEERASYNEAVRPFREERDALEAERDAISDAILARAEERIDEHMANWPREPVDRTGTEETFEPVEAKYLRLISEGADNNPYATTNHKIDEFEAYTAGESPRNVAASANGGSAEGRGRNAEDFGEAYKADVAIDGKFGVSWIAVGPELTITFAKPERIDRVYFSSDRNDAIGKDNPEARFVCEYRIEVSQDGDTWTEVANSHDRKPVNDAHRRKRLLAAETTADEQAKLAELDGKIAKLDEKIRSVPGLPQIWAGVLNQPGESFYIFEGGSPQRKGAEVAPASIKAASLKAPGYELDAGAAERERRRALAEWITNDENPLTARVLANRIWHYHFGTGIVATPSDFGFMGGDPSHPQLLDWLANELVHPSSGVDDARRLKRVHKMIMMSQAYRQSAAHREHAARIDGDSRLLWRFPPRRLRAEEVRDTMLQVAGELDLTMGGPGFRLYRYIRDNVSTYIPLDEHPPETYRRSVYHQNVRAARVDVMTDFDFPDCAMSAPRRVSTTSPLQALTLMNHSFTLDMAASLAERLRNDADTCEGQVSRAFELAFSRKATDAEKQEACGLIEKHGLEAFCRALFNANEMIYIY